MLPKVSCLCPTFARAYLLEEAVESFLRQDYEGPKELVIFNDFDQQVLEFDHPEVRVTNTSERCPSLGAKRNLTASLATGDLLLTWGDDDIHLPGRISRMVSALQGGSYLLEGWHYCYLGGAMRLNRFATAGAHIITKELYESLGGVPETNSGEDVSFHGRIKQTLGTVSMCEDDPQFIYRWDSGRPHISAVAQQLSDSEDCYARMLQLAQGAVNSGREPRGEYRLIPHLTQDWETLARQAA